MQRILRQVHCDGLSELAEQSLHAGVHGVSPRTDPAESKPSLKTSHVCMVLPLHTCCSGLALVSACVHATARNPRVIQHRPAVNACTAGRQKTRTTAGQVTRAATAGFRLLCLVYMDPRSIKASNLVLPCINKMSRILTQLSCAVHDVERNCVQEAYSMGPEGNRRSCSAHQACPNGMHDEGTDHCLMHALYSQKLTLIS
jgi:hypothetical protein